MQLNVLQVLRKKDRPNLSSHDDGARALSGIVLHKSFSSLPGAMQQGSGHIRHRHTIRGVLASTVRSEGIPGLYKGLGPTLFGILPYAGLKFYVYQSLKQQYRM